MKINPFVPIAILLAGWGLTRKKEDSDQGGDQAPQNAPSPTIKPGPSIRPDLLQMQPSSIRPQGSASLGPQGLTVIPGQASAPRLLVSADELIARIERGDKTVFQKPYKAIQTNKSNIAFVGGQKVVDPTAISAKSDLELKRMTVYFRSWKSFRYFGSLLSVGLLLWGDSDPTKKALGEGILDWFAYHRFAIGEELEIKIKASGANWSCSADSRLPAHEFRTYPRQRVPPSIGPFKGGPERAYPAISEWGYSANEERKAVARYCFAQMDRMDVSFDTVAQTFETRLANSFFGVNEKGIPTPGPCGALVEYASARYLQIAFAAGINPALGKVAGDLLYAAVGQAVSIAGAAIISVIAGSSAIPVVGWITSAIAAVGAAIMAAIQITKAIEKTREVRQKASEKLDGLLKSGWQNFYLAGLWAPDGGIAKFSGYRLDLLIPQMNYWSDVKGTTTNLFHHFALVADHPVLAGGLAVPQLPAYYLGLDFPMPVSVELPWNKIVALVPSLDAAGNIVEIKIETFSMEDYALLLKDFIEKHKRIGL